MRAISKIKYHWNCGQSHEKNKEYRQKPLKSLYIAGLFDFIFHEEYNYIKQYK